MVQTLKDKWDLVISYWKSESEISLTNDFASVSVMLFGTTPTIESIQLTLDFNPRVKPRRFLSDDLTHRQQFITLSGVSLAITTKSP